jgi:hypothetical protein
MRRPRRRVAARRRGLRNNLSDQESRDQVCQPAHERQLDAFRSRRRAADDAEIHDTAYLLHTVLGDTVDDVDFAYLADVAAGITR